jgi:hypothetical protein
VDKYIHDVPFVHVVHLSITYSRFFAACF